VDQKFSSVGDEGFTLIELMMVVLVIAILIAIAIPTFLGARSRAQNRTAQSNLRNALSAEKTIFTDASAYSSDATTALPSVEPSLRWVNGATTFNNAARNTVGVATGQTVVANDTVYLGVMADSGKCFYLRDQSNGAGVSYGNAAPAGGNCPAANSGSVSWNANQSAGWPS
jgi:type IV pilus assembly protein PilA